MALTFTNEELKSMRFLVRMELEDHTRSLEHLSDTPANIGRIKALEKKVAVLQSTLDKLNEAYAAGTC